MLPCSTVTNKKCLFSTKIIIVLVSALLKEFVNKYNWSVQINEITDLIHFGKTQGWQDSLHTNKTSLLTLPLNP